MVQRRIPVYATVEEVRTSYVVSAAYDGAGDALTDTTETTSVFLINSSAWAFEYKLNSGAWVRVEATRTATLEADLSTDTVRFRKTENAGTPVSVDVITTTKPTITVYAGDDVLGDVGGEGASVTFASQAEAEAGEINNKSMSPLRTKQAIDALAPEGGGDVATDAIWNAAGDLAVGTGPDTAARLAMGAPLEYLRVNAGGTALEYGTPAGGGDAQTANPLSQFAATTSDQLRGVLSDETGTGPAVFADSPALTGNPTAPTQSPGNNSTRVSTTAFVQAAIAALINSAPGALDTLDELAAAFGDDANFATTMTNALAGKQTLDATLTALAALTIAANSMTVGTGADEFSQITLAANRFLARSSVGNIEAKTITDQGLALLDDSTAAAQRTTIGAAAAFTSGTTITTSRAVAAGDIDKVTVVDTSSGDVVLTVDSGVFTAAEMIAGFRRSGANDLTVVAGTGTVNNPTGVLAQDGDEIYLKSTAANVVSVVGDEKIKRLSAVLPTDDTYQGTVITGLVSAGALTQWDAVYITGLSRLARADADAGGSPDATAAPARGLAVAAAGGADVAVGLLTKGVVRNDAWNWTPGETLYLSGTAGGLTHVQPTTGVVQPVGYAITADIAFFDFGVGFNFTVA
jgi:hypothetical protein